MKVNKMKPRAHLSSKSLIQPTRTYLKKVLHTVKPNLAETFGLFQY